ncbi:MAG TPA: LPS assembly lipoprotein LptE [Rhizomicrobium sp.]|nr:LPS assembly lipoprotein LptE [Rhizomicrobium sp.]
MSVKKARLGTALTLAALLGACGFHPMYSSDPGDNGGRQIFASIYVESISGEDAGENIGYNLRNLLIDDLSAAGRPAQATYRLKVTINQYLQGIAVANDATVTRYNYTMNANYELSDIHSNKLVKSGIERTLSAYDVVNSPYATLVAQQAAQKRGAVDIADRIRIDLAAYFSKHPKPQ